jgi:hypothetical protein
MYDPSTLDKDVAMNHKAILLGEIFRHLGFRKMAPNTDTSPLLSVAGFLRGNARFKISET